MARSDAAPLIALSHQISRDTSCAAQARDIGKLRDRAFALVNAHRVPSSLAESFISGVNALVAQTPVCLPSVTVTPARPVAPRPHEHHKEHHDKHDKHGGKGH